jgi:hypothetical protein
MRRDYPEIKVERKSTAAGEDAYVLRLSPERGAPVTLHVSARTYLIVQREVKGQTTTFADYRNVDGESVPFRTTGRGPLGEESVEVREVRFNEEIPAAAFSESGGRP